MSVGFRVSTVLVPLWQDCYISSRCIWAWEARRTPWLSLELLCVAGPCFPLCYQYVGGCKQWCPLAPPIRVPAVPPPNSGCSSTENWLPSLIVQMHFNVKLFFCTAWQVNLVKGPSVIFLLSAGHHVAGGIPSVTMCPALLPFFMWSFYPSFYVTCLLRPQFFLRRH